MTRPECAGTQRQVVAVLGFPDETAPAGSANLDPVEELADVRIATGEAGLERALPGADVLLVLDFRSDLLEKVWHAAQTVRWIHAASAGVDHLLFPELQNSPVVLTNARGVFDRPIAEWTLGMMLVFCKGLHTTLDLQRSATWEHRESEPLAGRRVLVVGAGEIGRAVARLASAAGMDVTVVARTARDDAELGRVVGTAELDDELAEADFVVLAAPLTEATHGLMNAQRLRRMRRGARLINVGRGELVDETALLASLEDDHLGGAALDVFMTEPLPAGHRFWTMPNVVVSPHMAGDEIGWRDALIAQFTRSLRRWMRGDPIANVVDKNAGYVTSMGAPPT
jgi:phosphoglycerate dehydrogenase-like enzyme